MEVSESTEKYCHIGCTSADVKFSSEKVVKYWKAFKIVKDGK